MRDAPRAERAFKRPLIVLSANCCRNLTHFRRPLLSALQNAGYDVIAVAPLDGHEDVLRSQGIEVLPVSLARSGMNPVADARLLLSYVRLLRRLRPTAYCSFTIKPNVFGGLAARICGVPAVANVTGLGTTFLAQGTLWRLVRTLYRLGLQKAHTVFFHNTEDLWAFVHADLVSSAQARLVPGSGVDLQRFHPELPSLEESGRIFLFVGRLLRDKGVREFVAAAEKLRPDFPTARFQILGDVDLQNRTSVSTCELTSWIKRGVIEHLPEREDVRPIMRSATAVVLPSYREGLSRALLEAAALGKPLIGTDVPGVRELAEEGVTGALCKPRDAKSLAAALERVARMPSWRIHELGANARARVEKDFGEQLVLDAYLTVLNAIFAGGRARGSQNTRRRPQGSRAS